MKVCIQELFPVIFWLDKDFFRISKEFYNILNNFGNYILFFFWELHHFFQDCYIIYCTNLFNRIFRKHSSSSRTLSTNFSKKSCRYSSKKPRKESSRDFFKSLFWNLFRNFTKRLSKNFPGILLQEFTLRFCPEYVNSTGFSEFFFFC